MPNDYRAILIRGRWFASEHIGSITYLYRGEAGNLVADVHLLSLWERRIKLGWRTRINPDLHLRNTWRPTRKWAIAAAIKRIEDYYGRT